MTSISPDGSDPAGKNGQSEEAAVIERIRRKAQSRRLAVARSLAARIYVAPDGTRIFIRFTQSQRFEHQVLIVTFTLLALTGLLQRFSSLLSVSWTINVVFGGVETLRTIHHLAAVVFILEAIYHLGHILLIWFVKKERGSMWPQWKDLLDLLQMLKHNLGLARQKPAFDRFSFEEKVEYWALLWGSAIMILTGLVQWFPTLITLLLPGDAIPISRAIHGWEAVLAVLSILIWHLYHTVIKEKNKSIFTGLMSEKEMEESHPLEYRRILAAHEYLQRLKEKMAAEDKDKSLESEQALADERA